MPIRPHRSALGESRAAVAALSPAARGMGGAAAPSVYDFAHASGESGLTIPLATPHRYISGGGAFGDLSFTLNRLCLKPFFVGRAGYSVKSMSVRHSSGAGPATALLGIYKCAPPSARDIYPTELVKDFGSIALNSGTDTTIVTTAESPVFLPNGLYYTAFKQASGTVAFAYGGSAGGNTAYDMTVVMGRALSNSSNQRFAAFAATDAGATLPAFFPAGGVISYALQDTGPLIGVNVVGG